MLVTWLSVVKLLRNQRSKKVTINNLAKMNPKLGEEKDDEGRASEG